MGPSSAHLGPLGGDSGAKCRMDTGLLCRPFSVEHWLKVIAAWPMQASLAASMQRMTQLFSRRVRPAN